MLKFLIPVLATALLAWGAWATVSVTSMTPREIFDKHCEEANKKIEKNQQRLEDKIDRLQEIIIDKLGD